MQFSSYLLHLFRPCWSYKHLQQTMDNACMYATYPLPIPSCTKMDQGEVATLLDLLLQMTFCWLIKGSGGLCIEDISKICHDFAAFWKGDIMQNIITNLLTDLEETKEVNDSEHGFVFSSAFYGEMQATNKEEIRWVSHEQLVSALQLNRYRSVYDNARKRATKNCVRYFSFSCSNWCDMH